MKVALFSVLSFKNIPNVDKDYIECLNCNSNIISEWYTVQQNSPPRKNL